MKITWYPLDATKVVPYLLNKERVEIDFPAGAEKLWEMVGAVLKVFVSSIFTVISPHLLVPYIYKHLSFRICETIKLLIWNTSSSLSGWILTFTMWIWRSIPAR